GVGHPLAVAILRRAARLRAGGTGRAGLVRAAILGIGDAVAVVVGIGAAVLVFGLVEILGDVRALVGVVRHAVAVVVEIGAAVVILEAVAVVRKLAALVVLVEDSVLVDVGKARREAEPDHHARERRADGIGEPELDPGRQREVAELIAGHDVEERRG